MRHFPRLWGLIACFAILGGVTSVSASASTAQAALASKTHSALTSEITRQAVPDTELIGELYNHFNEWCLDGRLGTGNVTMKPCGTDSTHQQWDFFISNSGDTLRNVFNGLCLDGRLGTGNVTLQPCGSDGTHELWGTIPYGVGGSFLQNFFNIWCLDGRLGTGNVTVEPCGTDSTHQDWTLIQN